MKRRQFFIPNVAYWHWERIEPRYVRTMYDRSRESYLEMENALAQLDEDADKIGQEIRGVWSSANANMMRAFEERLKEVRSERKRVVNMQTKLVGVMDRMRAFLDERRSINV